MTFCNDSTSFCKISFNDKPRNSPDIGLRSVTFSINCSPRFNGVSKVTVSIIGIFMLMSHGNKIKVQGAALRPLKTLTPSQWHDVGLPSGQ